ncbi:hypothetical protein [Paracoccus endophyticus]|uniref:hypothetical protein n=1 Tax=Paracoccus endophyticus TaxID=2233774 RepID=UPI0013A6EE63|nr:hypothetical protein [Paracoccus endophyticus]
MTPPKRPRGRPPKALGANPYDAPAVPRAARTALVEALVKAPAPRGGVRPAAALAEATPDWPRYRSADGAPHRNADGLEREAVERKAVERWLRRQPDLHWLAAIEARQRDSDAVRSFGAVHQRVAQALEAFAADPQSETALAGAARSVALLPPDPAPPVGQRRLAPDPERLTEERLLAAVGDPAALAVLAPVALTLAADCRRVADEVEKWRAENAIGGGRAAVARDVARVVAAFFDAAGMGERVRFARDNSGKGDRRGPANAYCSATAAALAALDLGGEESGVWVRSAAEVCSERAAAAGAAKAVSSES